MSKYQDKVDIYIPQFGINSTTKQVKSPTFILSASGIGCFIEITDTPEIIGFVGERIGGQTAKITMNLATAINCSIGAILVDTKTQECWQVLNSPATYDVGISKDFSVNCNKMYITPTFMDIIPEPEH